MKTNLTRSAICWFPAILFCFLFFSGSLRAATKTSAATGNWSASATWSPAGRPASGDDVIITAAHVVTVDSIFVCNHLNLGSSNANATLQITSSSNSLTINGDLRINSTGRNRTYILNAGPGTINVAGTFNTWGTAGTNSITIGTGSVNFTPAVTITNANQNITFTAGGSVTFNSAFTDQRNRLVEFNGCTVNFKSSYIVNTTAIDWAGNGTAVFWDGSSITPTTAITFNHIQTNTSASVTLNNGAGAVIVGGNVTLASGSTFTTNKNFEVGGNWTNNGGTFSGSAYTVTLNGSSGTIGGTASTTFGTLQIGRTGGSTAVSYTLNNDNTCSYLSLNGSTVARTLSLSSDKTLAVSNDLTITQPTASSLTTLLSVGAGICNVSGNLIFSGSNSTTTRVAKIDVTSGTFALTGSVTWMSPNTVVETEVITVSTGTITFGSSLTMGSQSGTLAVTSTGTINFNGSSAPSFTFGGATAPVFTTTNGCTINFAKGFTNNTSAYTFAATSQTNFSGTGTITPTTAITFGHLAVNASFTGTLATGAAIIVAGNVTIGSGATLTTNQSFEVGGNWTNNGGTFSGSAYTVTLNNSSGTIGGTASTTFGTLQIGRTSGSTAVSYTLNNDNTCSYLSLNGSTVAITLNISSDKTLSVNDDLTINQPTASSITSLLSVGAGICNVSGNLIFSGSNSTTTRVAKIDVTSGTFALTGSVTWLSPNTVVETEVITVSTGTITFSSSLTMGSQSGTLAVTSTGTINFNGSAAPSFTFGGATAPVFTTTNGCTINFAKGFTNNTSALTFAATSQTNFSGTGTITPTAAITFGNITVSPAIAITVTSAAAVVMAGTITLGSGASYTHNQDFTVNGNWTNNGGTFTTSGTVTFSGSTPATIGGSSPTTFTNLVINNSGGVTLNVSPAAPTVVTGSLTLTSGVITTTSSNILKLAAGATSSAGSVNSYINGPMIKVGNTDFTFPIGKSGKWMRVGTSELSTATTEITAEYFANPYSDTTSKTGELKEVSQIEYWEVNRTVTADHVKLKFYWEDLSASGIYNCENLTIAHYTSGSWQEEPATFTGGNCTGQASGSITMNGTVSTFSPFGFGGIGSGALPIKLVSFDAIPRGNIVETSWSTDLEINNAYFTVERSRDGNSFSEINRVEGAGNSTSLLNYNAVDENPIRGISYYRLRQTDFDGQYSYSNIVAVTIGEQTGYKLFPNPTQGEFFVNVSNPSSEIQLSIYDMVGRKIYAKTVEALQGSSNQTISIAPNNLITPGVYLVSTSANGTEFKERVVVN